MVRFGVFAWLACIVAIAGCGIKSGAGISVENLRCEYLANPLGIDVIKPRLGWIPRPRSGAETDRVSDHRRLHEGKQSRPERATVGFRYGEIRPVLADTLWRR